MREGTSLECIYIYRIIKEYFETLCANKFGNLDEMEILLEKHKPPKLTKNIYIWRKRERGNLNSPILKKWNL